MLRKDGRSSPSDRQSTASRRIRGADAKSSMGARVSRTNAVPVSVADNDIRCVVTRYDMIMSNDARRGLALFAGGKHGVVTVRSALSGATPSSSGGSSKGGGDASSSTTSSRLQRETTAVDSVHRKHGTTVVCMELVTAGDAGYLWCGLTDGSVQVFRATAAPNATALSQPPSPRSMAGATRQTFVQQATTKCLVFEGRHHNGPITCIASSAEGAAVFTGGADWKINRWNSEEPFGVLGCVGSHSLAVRCLHVTSRGLISGGDDGKIKVWPFTTVEKPSTLEGHTAAVLTCVVHRGILWTGGEDATIRLWAVEGDRRCITVVTTHRTPIVSLQAYDAMMVSFDKGGNALVWDLNKAPGEIEALHCYQTLGGVQPPSATIRSTSATSSRSPSEASNVFAPSVGRNSVASSIGSAGTPKSLPVASPVAIHDVRLVANVHGFIAWVFTNDGAKLSFLPLRSIEEELELKYSDRALGDGLDDMMMGGGKAAMDDLQRQLEDAQQREERQHALLEDMQEEFAEFADILAEDLGEMLTETLDLFTTAQARAQNLFSASVTAVQNHNLKTANNFNKRAQELEHQLEELNGKLAERARQLAQANAKASTQVAAKQEEITKMNIELQRAHNENKQLTYEVKAAKENITTLEMMIKRHEAKLDKAARSDVESVQLRAELKITKEALEKLQVEAGRQAEEAARQRAKVMGDDVGRSQVLEEMERRLAAAIEAQAEAAGRARSLEADLRGRVAQIEDLEGELELQRRRSASVSNASAAIQQADSMSHDDMRTRFIAAELEIEGLRAQLEQAKLSTSIAEPGDGAGHGLLVAQLAEKQSRIDELESRLAVQSKQVRDMQAAVQALQASVTQKACAQRSGAATPSSDVAESTPAAGPNPPPPPANSVLEALQRDVAQRDETIAALKATLRERDARIADLEEQLQQDGGRSETKPHTSSPRRDDGRVAQDDTQQASSAQRSTGWRHASPPRDSTQPGGAAIPPAPAMSPMERLQFDMDAADGGDVTSPAATIGGGAYGVYGGLNLSTILDATPYNTRDRPRGSAAGLSASRVSTLGSRSGLMALRDAERILGSHRISLSGAAHSLALGAAVIVPPSQAQSNGPRQQRSGRASPVVLDFVEESNTRFSNDDQRDADDGAMHAEHDETDPNAEELSRLFRIIDRTQSRLRHLEKAVVHATSEPQKDAMLREIAVLHDSLTASQQQSPRVDASSDVLSTTASILDAARMRLVAAERVRMIREMPMHGPGSPLRRR